MTEPGGEQSWDRIVIEPSRSEQGQAVNWDDTIIDAAATDTGMRRSNNQD